jgi:hypothetical protein
MKISAPCRASHTYVQHLDGSPNEIFPLLCPVREADWIEGWEPLRVISESGVAEPDCVFVTPAKPQDAIWYIVRHDPQTYYVEMLKLTPSVTACRLTIELAPEGCGSTAAVTYTHTSLGPEGDKLVAGFTKDFYAAFMQDWESQLNHYLRSIKE